MANILTLKRDNSELSELYRQFSEVVEMAASMERTWAGRAKPYCVKAIEVFRLFAAGKANTSDVKAQFALLTTLGGSEVMMNDRETNSVYCLAEIAHAAAHLGHLVVAMSRNGKANRHYEALQRSYVMFGLTGAEKYAQKAERGASRSRSNKIEELLDKIF